MTPCVLFAGMVAISSRRVKQHQTRMLIGAGLHGITLSTFWLLAWQRAPLYAGDSAGAYNLLFWVQIGLGGLSICLGAVTLWAVAEHAWELHRRTGMFTFFSASVCSIVTFIMVVMIWLS